MNIEELLSLVPEDKKNTVKLFIEQNNKEGIEQGRKENVEGRVKRELKDSIKKAEETALENLRTKYGDNFEESLEKYSEIKANEWKTNAKESLKSYDINDKHFEYVLSSAGISEETDSKDYNKLIEKYKKDNEMFFGNNSKPTIKTPTTPEPTVGGLGQGKDLPRTADGKIDKSKITDPNTLKMIELSEK